MDGDARTSEVLLSSTEKVIGTDAVRIGNISEQVCYGRMFFKKTSTGDVVLICFGNGLPSPSNYHIQLTDTFPIFDDAPVIGDITAICVTPAGAPASTGKLTTYVRGGLWNSVLANR